MRRSLLGGFGELFYFSSLEDLGGLCSYDNLDTLSLGAGGLGLMILASGMISATLGTRGFLGI